MTGVSRAAAIAAAQLVLLAYCAAAGAACPADATSPTAATASVATAALLCDINDVRASAGLAPLSLDARLGAAAQNLADDLSAHRLFSHVASDGETLTERVAQSGYTAERAGWHVGENIAWGSSVLAAPFQVTTGWMNSADHRRNLLDGGFRDVGIGIAQGAPDGMTASGTYYVADFGASGTPIAAARATRHQRRHAHHRRGAHHRRRAHHRVKAVVNGVGSRP